MGIGRDSLKRRAVLLDRDGVINEAVVRDGKPYPPRDATELIIVPGAAEALAELKSRGFLLIVVTNQPDVRRGKTPVQVVEEIHAALASRLPLDDFFMCPHDDRDACDCRKPLPGLLLQAAAKYDFNLRTSYMIGDRWRDIAAGFAAGCRTIFIDRRYNERSPEPRPDVSVSTLVEAVRWILKQEDKSSE